MCGLSKEASSQATVPARTGTRAQQIPFNVYPRPSSYVNHLDPTHTPTACWRVTNLPFEIHYADLFTPFLKEATPLMPSLGLI